MIVTSLNVKSMTGAEMDALFSQSSPGPIPKGRSKGTAIIIPASTFGHFLTGLIRFLIWKGKAFNPANEDLRNLVTPFGVRAIRAKTYLGTSWFDGSEAIILDYSKTSFVAQKIRDEIREVAPGIYIGQVFWGKKRIIRFMLEV